MSDGIENIKELNELLKILLAKFINRIKIKITMLLITFIIMALN